MAVGMIGLGPPPIQMGSGSLRRMRVPDEQGPGFSFNQGGTDPNMPQLLALLLGQKNDAARLKFEEESALRSHSLAESELKRAGEQDTERTRLKERELDLLGKRMTQEREIADAQAMREWAGAGLHNSLLIAGQTMDAIIGPGGKKEFFESEARDQLAGEMNPYDVRMAQIRAKLAYVGSEGREGTTAADVKEMLPDIERHLRAMYDDADKALSDKDASPFRKAGAAVYLGGKKEGANTSYQEEILSLLQNAYANAGEPERAKIRNLSEDATGRFVKMAPKTAEAMRTFNRYLEQPEFYDAVLANKGRFMEQLADRAAAERAGQKNLGPRPKFVEDTIFSDYPLTQLSDLLQFGGETTGRAAAAEKMGPIAAEYKTRWTGAGASTVKMTNAQIGDWAATGNPPTVLSRGTPLEGPGGRPPPGAVWQQSPNRFGPTSTGRGSDRADEALRALLEMTMMGPPEDPATENLRRLIEQGRR